MKKSTLWLDLTKRQIAKICKEAGRPEDFMLEWIGSGSTDSADICRMLKWAEIANGIIKKNVTKTKS